MLVSCQFSFSYYGCMTWWNDPWTNHLKQRTMMNTKLLPFGPGRPFSPSGPFRPLPPGFPASPEGPVSHEKKPIPFYVCCENKCVHCKHKCINWQQYDGSHICQMGWCIRRVFLQDFCCCLAFDKTWAIFMFKSLQCIISINLAGVQLSNIRKPLKLSDFARWPYWIRKRNNN